MPDKRHRPDRPQRADGNRTRNALLDAALAVWSEDGIDSVTMHAVAARAGKTRGTVYHHFSDRADLILSVQRQLDDRLTTLFDMNKVAARNDYLVVPGLIVDSPELLKSYFLRLLGGDVATDSLMRVARAHYRDVAARGWLRPGIDPDHSAVISLSMWLAALLAVDLHRDADARRRAARAFAQTFQRVMESSITVPVTERADP